MYKKKPLILAFATFCLSFTLSAQDDINKLLELDDSNEPLLATFKATRIINAHTNETVRKRNLDFRVAHRFGNIGKRSGGGVHSLYGFDNSADINIAFEYGVSDRFTLGFSRSKANEALQGSVKYKLLQQTVNNEKPLSVTLFANTVVNPSLATDARFDNGAHRLSYVYQAILAKKFSPGLSLVLLPTLIHRNWVLDLNDENTNFAIGGGGRIKLTKRQALIFDCFYTFSDFRKTAKRTDGDKVYSLPLSLGWEIETGGHVFSLMFSNAAGIIENEYLVNTTDSWLRGGFKFAFIINRTFKV